MKSEHIDELQVIPLETEVHREALVRFDLGIIRFIARK